MKNITKINGFTLIEILAVVALIAILAVVTITAINPAKNFADSRNFTRKSDVRSILNAVTQYTSDQGNNLSDFGTINICPETSNIGTAAGNVDIADLLVDEFLVAVPEDPGTGTSEETGYTICQTLGARVQIDAPSAENGLIISVNQ